MEMALRQVNIALLTTFLPYCADTQSTCDPERQAMPKPLSQSKRSCHLRDQKQWTIDMAPSQTALQPGIPASSRSWIFLLIQCTTLTVRIWCWRGFQDMCQEGHKIVLATAVISQQMSVVSARARHGVYHPWFLPMFLIVIDWQASRELDLACKGTDPWGLWLCHLEI